MTVNLMRFKAFEWPVNPENVEVAHLLGEGGGMVRLVRGDGLFYGRDAERYFADLAGLVKDSSPGSLYLPGVGYFEAVLKRVSLLGEPGEKAVRYSFEFCEASPAREEGEGYYFPDEDTSLWEIAGLFDMKIDAMVSLNPEIRNPSFVKAGTKVRVR